MKYLSLFSGIEAATAAWHPLGWECVAVSEIEPFPCAVLAHHYPGVPNLGDVTQITEFDIMALGPIDLVVFGSPCQDLSVAGNRKGLTNADGTITRSGLFFTAIDIFHWARKHCGARFALWENVPGAFSSGKGRDFASVVSFMAGLDDVDVPPNGWGTEGAALGDHGLLEWSILDAQFMGLAQRRRRVFALLDTGDWAGRPPILLEPESLRGDTAPRRVTGQVAPTLPSLRLGGGGLGTDFDCDGGLIANTLDASSGTERFGALGSSSPQAQAVAYGIRTANTSSNGWGIQEECTHTLDQAQGQAVAFDTTQITSPLNCSNPQAGDPCRPLAASAHVPAVAFSCKDYGADVGPISPTLRAMGHGASHANAGGQVAVAFAVSLRGREGGATAELGDEVGNGLRASGDGGDKAHVLTVKHTCSAPYSCENKGFEKGVNHGSETERNAVALLRRVQEAIGTQAFAKWGLGILDSLQSPEILRSALHGFEFRPASFSRRWVVCCALGSPFSRSAGAMYSMREAAGEGCASQGWGFSEQQFDELGAYLSGLPQPGAQAERFMHYLWQASDGIRVLREALSAIQEARRPAGREGQPVHTTAQGLGTEPSEGVQGAGMRGEIPRERALQQARAADPPGNAGTAGSDEEGSRYQGVGDQTFQVRRLVVEECEFLQGFPRGYTNVPYRNKPAADGPRYKALGNSMAVPVMRWIGMRVQRAVDLQGLLS